MKPVMKPIMKPIMKPDRNYSILLNFKQTDGSFNVMFLAIYIMQEILDAKHSYTCLSASNFKCKYMHSTLSPRLDLRPAYLSEARNG